MRTRRRRRARRPTTPFKHCWQKTIRDPTFEGYTILDPAAEVISAARADGGIILFVGTKKQTQGPIEDYAKACGMPFVNQRWLGGEV